MISDELKVYGKIRFYSLPHRQKNILKMKYVPLNKTRNY